MRVIHARAKTPGPSVGNAFDGNLIMLTRVRWSAAGPVRREAGSVPELPSGAVTFCFTDIEGSTALSARLGEVLFAATIQRHREILRDAWRRAEEFFDRYLKNGAPVTSSR